MQENAPQESGPQENPPQDGESFEVGDRLPTRAGRLTRLRASRAIARRPVPYGIAALVLAVGLGIAGVSAVTTGHDAPDSSVQVSAADQQSRAEAAGRADRSARDATTLGTPSASASEATSPAAPAPATSTPSPASSPAAASPARTKPAAPPTQATTTAAKPKPAWVSPMPGAPTTSCFGMRWGVLHAGIDLAEPENTPIHAVGAGTVVTAGWAYTGYGISVVIDHGNGYLTHYAHQSRTAVQVGQRVAAGDVIGYEGSTGDSTGPHLHFEVHEGSLWNQLDPAPWMREHGVDLGC